MRIALLLSALVSLIASFTARAQNEVTITTVAEGLYYPVGMALLPDGGVLIAEAGGHGERSAGISLLRPDGALGRLLSWVPSGPVNGNLIGAPALAVSPDGEAIIIGFAGSQLHSLPSAAAQRLPEVPFSPLDLRRRQAERGAVFLLRPFDIAFAEGGAPVVTDAAGNGLLGEAADGSLRYGLRFPALDNPDYLGGRLEPMPTGLARYQKGFYVTMTGGCPHVPNSGELVAVADDGRQRTIVDGLNMPIDIALDAAGDLWLLEFAAPPRRSDCFTDLAALAPSGRLSRLNSQGLLETVVDGLDFPAAILPLPDGSLYVTEAYSGRLLHLTFEPQARAPQRYPPKDKPPAAYADIHDLDRALQDVINSHELTPYPGLELKEPESELTRLGRDLFFDPILSGDQNISCGTCHHPAFAMTDARVLPIGAGGQGLGEQRAFRALVNVSADTGRGHTGTVLNPFIDTFIPRNSPTIINSALLDKQFWDGRVEQAPAAAAVSTLEDAINDLDLADPLMAQVLFPITSQHEMAGVTFSSYPPMVIRAALLERLRTNDEYARRFAAVFNEPTISLRQLAQAIAAFERQLIFTESPWDDYLAGDANALNEDQKRGALLFFGALKSDVQCVSCHSGDLFTDQRFHNLLAPQIGPGKSNGIDGKDDFGRANVSFDYRDQYRFRTPGLRNVELTAPYFHSGAYGSLADVLWHHADPWRANIVYDPSEHLPAAFQDQVLPYDFARQAHSVPASMRAGLPLTEEDVVDMVDFLRSLTDPAARDLAHIAPAAVPSGLRLDPPPR